MYVGADESGVPGCRDEDTLVLGLGSLYGRMADRDRIPDGRLLPIPYTEAYFEAAFLRVSGAYNAILDALCPALDRIHGVDMGRTYWEHLLSFWLLHFLANVEDKRFRLKTLRDKAGQGHTVVVNGHVPGIPRDPMEFFNRLELNTDGVNGVLLGMVAELMGFPVRFANGKTPKPAAPGEPETPHGPVPLDTDGSTPILIPSWASGPVLAEELRKTYGAVHLLPFHKAPAPSGPCWEVVRASLAGLPAGAGHSTPDDLETCAQALLPLFLPAIYLETYAAVDALAQAYVTRGVFLNVSSTSCVDPVYMFASALSRHRHGSVIAFQQQGGGDGTNKRFLCEYSGRRTADAFITWGWRDALYDGAEVLPAPVVPLSARPPKPRTPNGKTGVFVSTSGSPNQSRINPWATSEGFVTYFQAQLDFYQTLDPEIAASLVYRPYPWRHYHWGSAETLRERFPQTPVSSEGSLMDVMTGARLVVIDHNSTSLLEALTLDVPLICYWSEAFQPLRAACAEDFAALRRAGVLFDTAEAAARQVNAVWHQAEAWWRSPQVQAAVRPFARKYAWTSPDYLARWDQVLRQLLHRVPANNTRNTHAASSLC